MHMLHRKRCTSTPAHNYEWTHICVHDKKGTVVDCGFVYLCALAHIK